MPTTPPPVIRPACPDDLRALAALENSSFETDRISRRSYARLLNSPSAEVLIAEAPGDCGAITGSAVVLFRRNSNSARLYSIAVDAGHAGHGLGRALLEAAEGAARGRQCATMRLEAREDNRAAIGLYRAGGYQPAGRATNYYGDGCAALRFTKPLNRATGMEAAVND